MLHGIRITQLPDHAAGIACCEGIVGNGTGDHAAGSDDTVVADGNTGQDRYIGADPAIIADMHRFCVAEAPCHAVSAHQQPALVGQHRMQGRDDGNIGAECAVLADGDKIIVLAGEIEIDEVFLPIFV